MYDQIYIENIRPKASLVSESVVHCIMCKAFYIAVAIVVFFCIICKGFTLLLILILLCVLHNSIVARFGSFKRVWGHSKWHQEGLCKSTCFFVNVFVFVFVEVFLFLFDLSTLSNLTDMDRAHVSQRCKHRVFNIPMPILATSSSTSTSTMPILASSTNTTLMVIILSKDLWLLWSILMGVSTALCSICFKFWLLWKSCTVCGSGSISRNLPKQELKSPLLWCLACRVVAFQEIFPPSKMKLECKCFDEHLVSRV